MFLRPENRKGEVVVKCQITKEMKAKLDAVCLAENLHSNEFLLCLLQEFFEREAYKFTLWNRLVLDKEITSTSKGKQKTFEGEALP